MPVAGKKSRWPVCNPVFTDKPPHAGNYFPFQKSVVAN